MISLDEVENSELLKDEVKLHQLLSEHESIISIIEHFIEENILYVITEYAESIYITYTFISNKLYNRGRFKAGISYKEEKERKFEEECNGKYSGRQTEEQRNIKS